MMETRYTLIQKFGNVDYFLNCELLINDPIINAKTLIWTDDPFDASLMHEALYQRVNHWLITNGASAKQIRTIKTVR